MIVDLQIDLETADGGLMAPADLVAGAKSAGLDGVLLTHGDDFGFDVGPYREAAGDDGLVVFRGAQVKSNHGLLLCIVPAESEVSTDGWTAEAEGLYDAHTVIDGVEALGGVTVALRPYDREVAQPMGDHLFSLQGLAACEVMTGGLSDIANDLALEAASNMEMPCVGTSGGHGVSGMGSVATLFRSVASSETELCDAIRTGDCWPITMSETVPKGDAPEERSGRGRGRGDRDGARREGGRGRGRGPRGGEPGRDGGNRDGGNRDGGGRDGGGRGGRAGGEGGRGGVEGGRGGAEAGRAGPDGGRGGEGGRAGPDGGRGGRDGGRGGRGRDGGRGGRGGGGGGGDNRGNKRRGGRGRGGQAGPKPEDIGNRVPRGRSMAEDAGNLFREEVEAPVLAENLGNRLSPENPSPYRRDEEQPAAPVVNDVDDNLGNR